LEDPSRKPFNGGGSHHQEKGYGEFIGIIVVVVVTVHFIVDISIWVRNKERKK
jgi:hypothetical protein